MESTCLHSDGRIEETIKIIDLGDRPNSRSRIARGRLLIDTDRRRESANLIHLRILIDRGYNHTSIGREALEIPALSLGIDRIERKRGFTRPRNARYDDKFVFWDSQGYITEIVSLGSDNFEELGHG